MAEDRTNNLITFYLKDQLFGLELHPVSEVLAIPEITNPGNLSYMQTGAVKGFFDLRGTIVPVIDLKIQLGLPACPLTLANKVIVAQHAQSLFGLIVDELGSVLHLTREQLSPAPEVDCGIPRIYVKGVGRLSEGLIVIISLEELLGAFQRVFAVERDAREPVAG